MLIKFGVFIKPWERLGGTLNCAFLFLALLDVLDCFWFIAFTI